MLDRLLVPTWSLLLLGGLLSCDASPSGPDRAPVAQVVISPTSAQVELGGSQPFAAAVRDAAGNPLSGRRVLLVERGQHHRTCLAGRDRQRRGDG